MSFGWLTRRRVLVISGGALLLSLVLLAFVTARKAPPPPLVPFSHVLLDADAGRVAGMEIRPEGLVVTRRDGSVVRSVAPAGYVASNPAFVPDLVRAGVTVDVKAGGGESHGPAALLLTIAIVGLVALGAWRVTSGRLPSMEGAGRRATKGDQRVTFADVAGVDEARAELEDVVSFLREPGRFGAVGGRVPKGVLLVGPPGTGKTLLARAVAGEAGVPFLFASGSDFVEMFAGVGAARVRRLFKDARRHPAAIIFIDELDAVGRSRGGQSLSHEEREQTLNQLLVEMDGFAATQGIVVLAATNRPDVLDAALLRPGRFDRQVMVSAPDLRGREAILALHVRRLALDADVDLAPIARATPGFAGAELANLVNEAALSAGRDGRTVVRAADFEAARDRVLMGAERRSLILSQDERETTAWHEAGHAVVAAHLADADPLHKVTIIPRGRAMGVTMQLPERDRHTYTRGYLEAQIAILMAGRVAEELYTGRVTSGAGSDIERATGLARRMVCELGMSPLGPIAFRRPGPHEADAATGYSDAMALRVDEETRALVLRGCHTARGILEAQAAGVRALATELLAVESLDAEGIRAVLASAGREARPVAAMDREPTGRPDQ